MDTDAHEWESDLTEVVSARRECQFRRSDRGGPRGGRRWQKRRPDSQCRTRWRLRGQSVDNGPFGFGSCSGNILNTCRGRANTLPVQRLAGKQGRRGRPIRQGWRQECRRIPSDPKAFANELPGVPAEVGSGRNVPSRSRWSWLGYRIHRSCLSQNTGGSSTDDVALPENFWRTFSGITLMRLKDAKTS